MHPPTYPPAPTRLQVLRCFDYKTGCMRAVKIIRNKKRFHHQARAAREDLSPLAPHGSSPSLGFTTQSFPLCGCYTTPH